MRSSYRSILAISCMTLGTSAVSGLAVYWVFPVQETARSEIPGGQPVVAATAHDATGQLIDKNVQIGQMTADQGLASDTQGADAQRITPADSDDLSPPSTVEPVRL